MRNKEFFIILLVAVFLVASLTIKGLTSEKIYTRSLSQTNSFKPIIFTLEKNVPVMVVPCDRDVGMLTSIYNSFPQIQHKSSKPFSMGYSYTSYNSAHQIITGLQLIGKLTIHSYDEFSKLGAEFVYGPDRETLTKQGWLFDNKISPVGNDGFKNGYRKFCMEKEKILLLSRQNQFEHSVDPKAGLITKYPGTVLFTTFLSDSFQPQEIPQIYPKTNWEPTYIWKMHLDGGAYGPAIDLDAWRNESNITSTNPSAFVEYYRAELLARGWKKIATTSPPKAGSQMELYRHGSSSNEEPLFVFGYDPVLRNNQIVGYIFYIEHN